MESHDIVDRQKFADHAGGIVRLLPRFTSWVKWMAKPQRLENEMEAEVRGEANHGDRG
jgi:hypothetical protein